jgi:hypothetical protein
MFSLFEDVFRNTGVEIVKVLGTFTISPIATREILSWKNAYTNASVLAIAPYFDCGNLGSPSNSAKTSILSVAQVLHSCRDTMPIVKDYIAAVKEVTKLYNNFPIMTYEAGQSLVETAVMEWNNGETPGLTDLFISVNRDAGMTDIYKTYINMLIDSQVVSQRFPLMHYVSVTYPSKYGSWGAIESSDQPKLAAPKYVALRSFFNSKPIQSRRNLLSIANLFLGDEDNTFIGYPAVVSPRYKDIIFPGLTQTIEWSKSISNYSVNIFLWKGEYVDAINALTSTFVQVGKDIPMDRGFHAFLLLSDTKLFLDGSNSFFFEIRGPVYSNFSDYFTIKSSQYFYKAVKNWHCCGSQILPEFDDCFKTAVPILKNPLVSLSSQWSRSTSFSSPCASLNGFNCSVNNEGCRTYSTNGGKQIIDCTALSSPFPPSLISLGEKQNDMSQCRVNDNTAFTPSLDIVSQCKDINNSKDIFCPASPVLPTTKSVCGEKTCATLPPDSMYSEAQTYKNGFLLYFIFMCLSMIIQY